MHQCVGLERRAEWIRGVVVWRSPVRPNDRRCDVRSVLHETDSLKVGRSRLTIVASSLAVVIALVIGFAIGASAVSEVRDGGSSQEQADVAAQLETLRDAATSLDRERTSNDELPAKLERLLQELSNQMPAAAEESMRVVAAPIGDLYVAPLPTGFAILSTIGFAGTVPDGLTDANPAVGGTAVLPNGRLALLGIAADDVVKVIVGVRSNRNEIRPAENGIWWVSDEKSLDPDDLAISARLADGRTVRIF
jgi:hypothetical protein